jgi:hypothetical protein
VRTLRLYESWHLMQYINLNNSKIASYLGYHEETHLPETAASFFISAQSNCASFPRKTFAICLKLKKAFRR